MLYIDNNNNITLTRGDTLTLTVGLFQEVEPVPPATEPTQEPYTPTENEDWSNHVQNKHLTGVELDANDEVAVRVRSRGSNYYGYVGTLTIKQTA